MRSAGVTLVVDAAQLSVVGISEALFKAPTLIKGLTTAKNHLRDQRPALLILIDFPDFNLRLAAEAKRLSIPVLYYISPQIWAWRPGRVQKIGALVDHVAVILPFEAAFYDRHSVPATFVGHPLMDDVRPVTTSAPEPGTPDFPIVGLLPGSRDGEIARHLPVMLAAAGLLQKHFANLRVLVSIAPTVKQANVDAIVARYSIRTACEFLTGGVDRIFNRSNLVVAASGTVTLEAGIAGTPTVIIYKVSPFSYVVGRLLAHVDRVGLVNLIADKELMPELIQGQATPERIAGTVTEMLNDSPGLARLRNSLLDVRSLLGGPGASERVAEIALGMI
jgi:lipid-A-disaccharide synthase